MKTLNTIKKGCGKLLKVGQGNLSPSKANELGVGIKCGEKYLKDKVHRRKELINKVIYCGDCKFILEQTEEIIEMIDNLKDEMYYKNAVLLKKEADWVISKIDKFKSALIGEEKKEE